MEHTEKKSEHAEHAKSSRSVEKQRYEARMSEEKQQWRRSEHAQLSQKSHDKAASSQTDRAEHPKVSRERIENLRLEIQQIEAKREWAKRGDARRTEGHKMGTEEHKLDAQTIRIQESAKGRQEGKDFDVEVEMERPQAKKKEVLDYVDYQRDIVADHKPIGVNDTPENVINNSKYKKQRERQIEAYEHKTGRKVKEYRYSCYPSMKDHHEQPEGKISPIKEIIITRDENGKESVFVEYRTDAMQKQQQEHQKN